MRFNVSVTFESDTQAPKTFRGEIEGGGVSSALRKAFMRAKQVFKGARWDSLCIVLEKNRESEGEE